MDVTLFTRDRRRAREFLALEDEVYRGDAAFVPPMRHERMARLEHTGERDEGPSVCLLAHARGRPVARARACAPRALRDSDGTPLGSVGLFEALDPHAAGDVLQAACDWLAARGRRRVWAPFDADVWHGYRAQTRGFERERFLGEPYNPPAYPEWLEAAGFAVRRRWHTFELHGEAPLDELIARHAGCAREIAALGWRCESLEGLSHARVIERLHPLLQQAFAGFLGFTPLSLDEFRALFALARHALEPRASVFILDAAGRDAGFTMAFDDLAAAVRAMRGRRSWLARARMWQARRQVRRVLLHLGGLSVAPGARPHGLARACLHDVVRRLRELRRASVLVTLVAEASPARGLFGPWAERPEREYALFERRC